MFDKDQPKSRRIPITDEERMPSVEEATADGDEAGLAEEIAGETQSEHLLAALENELSEARGAHLRAVADLQNFRRRAAEERAQQLQYANEGLIVELLPILDNFERATGCEIDGDAAQNLLKGVCMVQQQFVEVLNRFGVERLKTEGEFFDPARHDAMDRVETNEVCEGTIVGEVLPGYALNGKIIRPAKVRVAVQPH